MIIYDQFHLRPQLPRRGHFGSSTARLSSSSPFSFPPTHTLVLSGGRPRLRVVASSRRVQPTRIPQARLVRPSGRFDALTGGHVPHGHLRSHEDSPALFQWRLGASPSRGGHLRSRTVHWRNGIPVFGRALPPPQGDMFLMAI